MEDRKESVAGLPRRGRKPASQPPSGKSIFAEQKHKRNEEKKSETFCRMSRWWWTRLGSLKLQPELLANTKFFRPGGILRTSQQQEALFLGIV
jgi:hypothetical protein